MTALIKFCLLCSLILLAACSDTFGWYLDRPDVRIEILPSRTDRDIRILHAAAFDDDGETVVRGEVGFPKASREQVFLGVVQAEAAIGGRAAVPLRSGQIFLEPKPHVSGRRASFTVTAGRTLPEGSVVEIRYVERATAKP